MKKSKILSTLLVLLLILCLGCTLSVASFAENWRVTGTSGAYKENADGTISTTSQNSNWMNFYITDEYQASGDYTVSVDIAGTIDTNVTADAQAGIVPWYVDANNYIVVYASWASWDRPHEIRNLEITGFINGVDLSWYDIYTDGCGMLPADGLKMTVEKSGTTISVTMTSTDGTTYTKTGSRTIDGLTENMSARIGVFGSGDVFTFSNLQTTASAVPTAPTAQPVESTWTVRDTAKAGYTVNEDGSIVTAGTDNNGWNFLFADNVRAMGDYTITAEVQGTIADSVTGSVQMGIVPWYVDGDNYVVVYAAWESWDRPQEIRNLEITGRIGGTDLGWFDIFTDGCGIHPADGIKLEVTKTGNVISVTAKNASDAVIKTGSRTIDGLTENSGAKMGIYGCGDIVTFDNITFTHPVCETHTLTHVDAVPASCTSTGINEHYRCSVCDKYFSDANGTVEIAFADTIAAKPDHIGGEATCTHGKICTVCGTEYTEADATAHNPSAAWTSDETGHWHICQDCDAKVGEEAHISGGAATETDDEVCTVCGYVIATATGHIHDYQYVPEVPASCTSTGVAAHYTCTGCSALFSDTEGTEVTQESLTLGKNAHDFENSTVYHSDWDYHWKVCANCDAEDTEHKEACHGGTATLNTYAICEVCGHAYGYPDSDWKVTDRDSDGYQENTDGTVSSLGGANGDILSGSETFFLSDLWNANGDFTLSALITGQNTAADGGTVKLGLVPWYVDENNWIVVYVHWWEIRNGVAQMRNIEICGYIGGVWTDWSPNAMWCDGITVSPADGVRLEVTKNGTSFGIRLKDAAGSVLKEGSRDFSALTDSTEAKAGVYAFGDIATFSVVYDDGTVTPPANDWDVIDDTVVANNLSSMRDPSKFYLFGDSSAIGDYSVSVILTGTMGLPNTKVVQAGFVPWYLDENNYIIIYVEWDNNDRAGDIREIQVTGRIGGRPLVVYNDGFVEKEWNDIWCDGIHLAASSGVKLVVESKLSTVGDAVEITVRLFDSAGIQVKEGTVSIRDLVKYASVPAKVGLYAYNDTVTFSEYTYTDLHTDRNWAVVDGTVGKSESQEGWTIDEGTYRVDASESLDALSNVILIKNTLTDQSYRLSAALAASGLGDHAQVGILAWYLDEYNYLYAIVRQTADGVEFGFIGQTTYLSGVTKTVTEIEEFTAFSGSFDAITAIEVEKRGTRFTLRVGEESVSCISPEMLSAANWGLATADMIASFSNVTAERVTFEEYDWYSDRFGTDDTYYISAKTQDGITFENGVFTIGESAVDITGVIRTQIYTASGKFDIVSVSAKFTVGEETKFGVYPWFISETEYILVEVTPDGLTIYNTFANTDLTVSLPVGYTYAGTHTLTAEVANGYVTVTLDGTTLVSGTDFATGTLNRTLSPNVGFTVSATSAVVSELTVGGFIPKQPIIDGDWSLEGGAHADTWQVSDDGKTVIGRLEGGTTWMSTLALTDAEALRDFYMSATVLVSEVAGSEYKTGFVPYYLDGNNYVFVWLSKWADGSPCIVITARLNGRVVGTEWREQQVSYNYIGEVNYMEVEISGDTIRVYLNKSFNPSYSTTVEGLSDRTLDGAKVGFNISNTSATFGSITTQSNTRCFTMNEKPVIEEVTGRTTTGTVGTKVTLPICSASNSAGDSLTAVTTVTAPDGTLVTVERNGFVPDKAGKYTVTISCTDAWGNEAEPIVYEVLVSGGSSEQNPGTGDPSVPQPDAKKTPVGLIVGISVGAVAILGAGVTAVVLIKRKKH